MECRSAFGEMATRFAYLPEFLLDIKLPFFVYSTHPKGVLFLVRIRGSLIGLEVDDLVLSFLANEGVFSLDG
jgi:hypothetical protein